MKITVDQGSCIGCGMCIDMCPNVFEYNESGLSTAKSSEVANENIDLVKDAADCCPVDAIKVVE